MDVLPARSLPNEKGEVVEGLVAAEGNPLVGALNPNPGVLAVAATGAPPGAGAVDATAVDDPLLGAKKFVIVELPDGADAAERGFERSA